jgi:DNA-binding MarR family transcriptional regulator
MIVARTVLDLDNYVPALVNFVSNKLSAGASKTYRKLFGVGVTEWRIISLLAIEPNISANRICQVIGFDKALVSRAIQQMADRGYVSNGPDPSDARKKTVTLTRAGYDLHDRIIEVALEREQLLLSDFTPTERRILVDLLRRMHAQVAVVNAYHPDQPRPKRNVRRKAAVG